MPVVEKDLQTQCRQFIVKKNLRCPTLNTNYSWDEKSTGKVNNCIARPYSTINFCVTINVLHLLQNYWMSYMCVNERHERIIPEVM